MKQVPDENILLFKSCLVSVEYPGIESSTKFVFDKIGIDYDISDKQTCCTGLGHYSDVFDQFTTTAIGARNFKVASNLNRPNLVMMCATCYAINKKVANILNKKDDVRDKVNEVFDKSDLSYLKYDLSGYKIATHHGCHYCKVHYDDTIGGVRDPNIIDDIIEACGCKTVGWYDHKRQTCGSGFRQRYSNKDMSMEVTEDKLYSIKEDGVEILVHLCPNCHVQFDRYQNLISKKCGEEFNTIHLNVAQFVAIAMGGDFDEVIGAKAHTVPIDSVINDLREVD